MAEKRERLGRLLLEAKLITEEQLKMAVDFQESVGGRLGAIIVKLGFIEDMTLTNFIAKQQRLPVVDLEELVIPETLVRRLPRKLIEDHHVLPIHYKDGVLTVAISDPYDLEAIGALQLAHDAKIEIRLAPRSQIQKAIQQTFRSRDTRRAKVEKTPEEPVRKPEPAPKPAKVSKLFLHEALIPLLIEKGLITEDDLIRKARELESQSAGKETS